MIAATLAADDDRKEVSSFDDWSPEAVLAQFDLKLNPHQKTNLGFPFWSIRVRPDDKEWIMSGFVWLNKKGYVLNNRKVVGIELSFYMPTDKKKSQVWKLWKAEYVLQGTQRHIHSKQK
jgi:hypothetical protein